MRSVNRILSANRVNMGGIYLDQPLPHHGVDQIDPFLLVHHWKNTFKGGQEQKNVGVGPHPHRGFTPVTFIFKGGVHHRDSRGNSSIINEGGTQWMNSGMGIVHSERPRKDIAENGGDFEIIQFWINAPAKHKMDPPSYQPLSAEETPTYSSKDNKVQVAVVAGESNGVKGKISAYSDLMILRLSFDKNGKIEIPIPENYNAFVYQLDGKMNLDGKELGEKNLIWYNNDGKSIQLESNEATNAILLAGAPIKEQVYSYGPFVMNNQTQILQAMSDYQQGKMGVLIESFDE